MAGMAAILLLLVASTALGDGAAAGPGAGGNGAATSAGWLPAAATTKVRCTRWHAVSPGDTCCSVAKGAGLTVSLLRALNKYLNCAAVQNWRRLCVAGVDIN
ncbi:hypothetical protein HU200_024044 [Digitaria exilis]|uniref:LysM domain-containing protein n=1 Tax=Digitaria exilis TaxID=1010633 RepID=A0A835BXY5_9POAL|nr:hypothetical protein HU200_024044 [Digitaria exilis]